MNWFKQNVAQMRYKLALPSTEMDVLPHNIILASLEKYVASIPLVGMNKFSR